MSSTTSRALALAFVCAGSLDCKSKCGDKLDCYMTKLADPNSHVGDKQFTGIKAAYMVGVLGKEDTKPKLVEMLPKIMNTASRFVAVQVIDHLSPKGDAATGEKLLKMLAEAEATKDAKKISEYSFFKQFGYRLLARQ